ncbi:MAG: hypothetical protein Q8L22_05930 [Reyranella sp.]|nr:hypothetical protein [Reyranella sp.]
MSVNRELAHILVLPEDDANRQLANGFVLNIATAQIQVLREVGGWARVRDRFASDHVDSMRKYPGRYMVLLIDFDGYIQRLQEMKAVIPQDLANRVFIFGARSEPEDLKRARLGTYETIGKAMAEDCRNGTQEMWAHNLLEHNQGELARMRNAACGILFGA